MFPNKIRGIVPIISIAIFNLAVFLPFFIDQQLLFSFQNDLSEFFVPMIEYVKKQILVNHQIPFWNNSLLSGTPLVTDPQSPIFYPFNIIFLVFNPPTGYLILFYVHFLIGSIGVYFISRLVLKYSTFSSLAISLIYPFIIRNFYYLEAGHVGIIFSNALVPYVLFLFNRTIISKTKICPILLGLLMSWLYFLHTPTIVLVSICLFLVFLWICFENRFDFNQIKSATKRIFLSVFVFLLLISPQLLPQISWFKETTRNILIENSQIYPIWNSKEEFIKHILIPWRVNNFSFDTEKGIAIGIIASLMAFLGFLKIKRSNKYPIILIVIFTLLISANNLTFLENLFARINFFKYLRITTRFWFINSFVTLLLIGRFLDGNSFSKLKKYFLSILVFLSILELLSGNIQIFSKHPSDNYVPMKLIKTIKEDKGLFRVFCIDRCIPQNLAVKEELQLIEGYNTLQQYNYYKEFWQFTNSYWNYYTLSLPPMGLYKFTTIIPDAKSLGEYNTKYVISPHKLTDSSFAFIQQDKNYYLYYNKQYLPRTYLLFNKKYLKNTHISNYQSNSIRIIINNNISPHLIISEVFSPGDGKLI